MKSERVLIKKTQNPMHILSTTSPARILPYLVPRTLNNLADCCYYLRQFLCKLVSFCDHVAPTKKYDPCKNTHTYKAQ